MSFLRISTLHNEDRLQGTLNNLSRGAGRPKLLIYDDSGVPQVPTSINMLPTGVLLVSVELDDPVGEINAGQIVMSLPDDAVVLARGRAHWARFVDGNGDASIDCGVTDTSGDGPVKISTLDLIEGSSLGTVTAVMG